MCQLVTGTCSSAPEVDIRSLRAIARQLASCTDPQEHAVLQVLVAWVLSCALFDTDVPSTTVWAIAEVLRAVLAGTAPEMAIGQVPVALRDDAVARLHGAEPAPRWDERLRRSLQIMKDRCLDPTLTETEVGRQAGLSQSRLSRLFKSETGFGFRVHLRALRLTHSIRLLRDVERSMEDVREGSGYRHLSTFDRDFRLTFGLPPRTLRTLASRPIETLLAPLPRICAGTASLEHSEIRDLVRAITRSPVTIVHRELKERIEN